MQLDDAQIQRYTHHIVLKDIGGEGQKKLLASRVLIVGAGGLGSPVALYLAAAGIGTLGIVDDDVVDISNLQRQILHHTDDVGREKVVSAKEKLAALNPDVRIIAHAQRMNEENADAIVLGYDFVIDATDNFSSKYLINDTCVRAGKPFSHAGVVGFRGQAFTYTPGSLCLRCIFTDPPPPGCVQDCRGSGIVGAAAGAVGSIQASEAIKYLLGRGELLIDKLFTMDLLSSEFRTIALKRNESCPICSGI